MMSWPAKPFFLFAVLVLGLGSLGGCQKGDELNVDLPGTAAIGTNYVDLPVTVSTVRQPVIQTLKAEHYLAGRLNDNLTGNTEARAVLSLLVGINDSLPSRFTTANEPDSVVITLGFDQVYGSASVPAKLDVLELGTALDERTVYNSTSVAPIKSVILKDQLVPLNKTRSVRQAVATSPNDSITIQVADRSVRLVVQSVRRPQRKKYVGPLVTDSVIVQTARPAIPSAFANSLFRKLQDYAISQDQLTAYLAGIVLAPSAGYNGGVLSFGRVQNSAVNVYFHPSTSRNRRAYRMFFGPSPTAATSGPATSTDPRYYTQLSTDFQTSSALAALQGSSASTRLPSASTNNTVYVQEGTGLATALNFTSPQFTSLLTLPGIAINRAELVLPVQPYSNALLSNPAQLYAVEVGPGNEVLQRVTGINAVDRVVQADGSNQQLRGNEARGLLYNTSSTNVYYDLLVTSYLQAYLSNAVASTLGGPLPDALLLTPALSTATTLTLNRAALSTTGMYLRVYYSRLRQ